MSMIGYLGPVTKLQVSAFRASPDLVSAYADQVTTRAVEASQEAMLAAMPPDIQARYREQVVASRHDFAARFDDPISPHDAKTLEGIGPFAPILSLDKDWHALHFLLSGHVGFEGGVGESLLGGEPLGPDVGYGPARLLSVEETAAFGAFLAPFDVRGVTARLDPSEMSRSGVYGVPFGDDLEDLKVWTAALGDQFEALRAFVDQSCSAGNAVLLWIS